MIVYVVFYGYEDVEKVFLKKENAQKFVEQQLKDEPNRRRDNYSILDEEVGDA